MIYLGKMNTKLPFVLLIALVSLMTFFIVYNANWSFGDQLQFLKTTALGEVLPISNYVIPELGRFFPLGLMDYNFLLLVPKGESALAHFILNAISFVIFAGLLFLLMLNISNLKTKNPFSSWIILFSVSFILFRYYTMFLDLIFPERIIGVLLSFFMLMTFKFYQSNNWLFGIGAIISAIYVVYCKEPIFGIFFVFSVYNFLFGYKIMTNKEKIFHSVLIFNGLVFVILYYFLVYRYSISLYDGSHGASDKIAIIWSMINSHKIILPALVLFSLRIFRIFHVTEKLNLYFDGLLFSGLAYFVACLFLQLNFTYYYLPAIVLITPAIVYWSIIYIKPLGTFIFLLIFSSFYAIKIPAIIVENQDTRKNTYSKISIIANCIPNGYQLIWYKADSLNNNSWDNILQDWKKTSLEAYVAFIVKDKNFRLTELNNLQNIQNKNLLILYPSENNSINPSTKLNFEKETVQFSKDTITTIADILAIELIQDNKYPNH